MTDTTQMTLETTTFTLNPVGCADCFWKIDNGLKEVSGIHDVQYDMGKITFEITFDPKKINRPRIIKIVEDMGYRLKGKHYETVGVFEGIRLAFQRNRAQKKVKKVKKA